MRLFFGHWLSAIFYRLSAIGKDGLAVRFWPIAMAESRSPKERGRRGDRTPKVDAALRGCRACAGAAAGVH
jgi:hypothetical protein